MEQQKQQTENYYIDRIDHAVASEEYKQMQNLLKPIELERERAAQSKVEKYVSNAGEANFSKYALMPGEGKQPLSQSSGFSTFDTFRLNLGTQGAAEPLRLDQMVTLAVFKSASGTIKKMLHGPSLKIYCVKEVPLSNRETR